MAQLLELGNVIGPPGPKGEKGDKGDSVLPEIASSDEGKVLTAKNGEWVAADLPKYTGSYTVTPSVSESSVHTAQKYMEDDITIKAIPYYDVSNTAGGSTVYIGKEIE